MRIATTGDYGAQLSFDHCESGRYAASDDIRTSDSGAIKTNFSKLHGGYGGIMAQND